MCVGHAESGIQSADLFDCVSSPDEESSQTGITAVCSWAIAAASSAAVRVVAVVV
jgi:hypothetical protein